MTTIRVKFSEATFDEFKKYMTVYDEMETVFEAVSVSGDNTVDFTIDENYYPETIAWVKDELDECEFPYVSINILN